MKTILITGGAGFIGSAFAHYIYEKYPDYKIIIVDALTYAGNIENLPVDICQTWTIPVSNSGTATSSMAHS